MSRLRLVPWYAAHTGSIALVPYQAVLLADAGLSPPAVAATIGLVPVGMLVGGPLWAWVADRTARPDAVLKGASLAALAAVAGLGFATSGPAIAVGLLALAVARAPQGPLVDALTVRTLADGGSGYGRVRLWGSGGFVVAAFASGWLRETWPRAPLAVTGLALAATALVTWTVLPRGAALPRPTGEALRRLVNDRSLAALLAVFVAHGVTLTAYDNLFSLHVEELGLGSGVVGTAISVGVLCEIGVMAAGPWLLARLGPARLALIGIASGVPRWLITGMATTPAALVAAQALHGLGFGGFWIAGVLLVARVAPPGLSGATQALLPAATFGAGALLSMGLAAALLGSVSTGPLFVAMAATSAAAALAMARLAPMQAPAAGLDPDRGG